MHWQHQLKDYTRQGFIPEKYSHLVEHFFLSYQNVLKFSHQNLEAHQDFFSTFIELFKKQCIEPHQFEPFHKMIREPFDYYAFGLDLVRPLIDLDRSSIKDKVVIQEVTSHIQNGDNVVFFANHQTETDPQILALLLEKIQSPLATELIFVAGQRVLTDPMAVPFSLGCNLLCIYSKKYIDHPPELKMQKQQHNQKTMKRMSGLLAEGGKCIYVAPSGGRDRPGPSGQIEVALFDPDSIEMFRLMAGHAGTKTHFYPMTLSTYDILPPPDTLQKELGEQRRAMRAPVHVVIGSEIDITPPPEDDKLKRRQMIADRFWQQVNFNFQKLLQS